MNANKSDTMCLVMFAQTVLTTHSTLKCYDSCSITVGAVAVVMVITVAVVAQTLVLLTEAAAVAAGIVVLVTVPVLVLPSWQRREEFQLCLIIVAHSI